jgi:O-antigen/teichoic acid export membrane protein
MTETTGFRDKIFASARLSTLRFLSDIGLRLISTVVLTRLLTPEIYGVFAIVLVYLYLLEMFSDFGVRTLILTREGKIEADFLQTCWTVSILRGGLIAVFSALLAAVIGLLQAQGVFAVDNSYAAPVLPWAIAAIGFATWVVGFQSPLRFMSEREMAFGKVTLLDVTVNVVGLISTILLAFYLRSIWALVLGAALRSTLLVVLSFIVFRGPPMRFCLNGSALRVIIDRGRWIIGHSALTALTRSADRLVLGFVMSSATFGFYFIARQLVDIAIRFLESIDAQMGLQVFTHLHKSTTEEFRRNYYRYRLFFDALAGLSTGGLFVLAPLLVEIIFDDRYSGVAPIAQTLIWSVLLIGPLLLRSAFSAERRFREMTVLSLLSTVTLWSGLAVAIFFFGSTELALSVIALYRLPEAMCFILLGGDRDWVVIWREFSGFVFCVVGILIGLACLQLWAIVT